MASRSLDKNTPPLLAPQPGHCLMPPTGAYTQLDSLLNSRFLAQDLSLSSSKPARSLLAGNLRTRYRGRGMDFEEVRLYQAGDDIRSIDWRVTARTQVPHTKLYREERERPVFLLVDQRASLFFGSRQCFKSVLACHLAATLGWAALAQGDRIGALVCGDLEQRDIRPRAGKHGQLALIQQLLAFNQRLNSPVAAPNAQSLAQLLADLRRISKPGSALFIISDFHDLNADSERELFNLARHADITLLQVFDPLERQLGSSQALMISDGQQQRLLPAQDKQFQQAYRARFEQHQAQLTLCAKRLGLALLSLDTHSDPAPALRQAFGRRR